MPNDAKLGLIAGVAVVLLIATMFFRKEPGQARAAAEPSAATSAAAPPAVVAPSVTPSTTPALPETRLPPLPPAAAPETEYKLPPLPPPPGISDSAP